MIWSSCAHGQEALARPMITVRFSHEANVRMNGARARRRRRAGGGGAGTAHGRVARAHLKEAHCQTVLNFVGRARVKRERAEVASQLARECLQVGLEHLKPIVLFLRKSTRGASLRLRRRTKRGTRLLSPLPARPSAVAKFAHPLASLWPVCRQSWQNTKQT